MQALNGHEAQRQQSSASNRVPAAAAQKCAISILAERWSGKPQFHFELYF